MTPFVHAPYATGKSPFSIGLAPLDLADWIESDELLVDQLARKEAILAEGPEAFAALEESAARCKISFVIVTPHSELLSR